MSKQLELFKHYAAKHKEFVEAAEVLVEAAWSADLGTVSARRQKKREDFKIYDDK